MDFARLSARRVDALRPLLESLYLEFNDPRYLGIDPLELVLRYSDPWDREAVALIAAVLAYGNVKQIRASVEGVLSIMHETAPGPAAYVRSLAAGKVDTHARMRMQERYHRFNVGDDFLALFSALDWSWTRYGFLGGHLASRLSLGLSPALDGLMDDWTGFLEARATSSFRYLLTPPRSGSCCKRWCMLMRWMGRRDAIDPGLWLADGPFRDLYARAAGSGLGNTRALAPTDLVFPLDTHTGKIVKLLKLTRRKSLDWKAAREVTHAFGQITPTDPVKFDFALCRVGMLDLMDRVRGS
jgi:uncharacterized protein (TIGR02757 family)